jgi:hypothetical protein
MRNLEIPLSELYSYINDAEKRSEDISSVNVGWHIEHSLLVIQKISESVIKSDQNKYKWKFSLPRLLVFPLNKFPRGKGKAPDIVIPTQKEKTDFDLLFSKTRSIIEELKKTKPNQYFIHPIFGMLNKKHTFIMLDIHTKHHIHIIKDILSKS